MSNSYRIRTQLGVNKSVKVKLEQDYEFLEILSLKFLQSEVYLRECSDYGVIVGRVSVNDGFGIPNVKVSVFLPLSRQDEVNPIISDIYPYKSLNELNEDGYRYNLLPYKKSYSAHVPTGTFFDKEDVLTDPTLIEVFDKYYKYTVRTNDSGDFMIFGAPIGTQTLHFDIDLSDIGEFSLSPQDLIRAGLATEAQVAGTSFRSSTNLNELPQIISINRDIQVEPLWGQEDLCTVGITRADIDLTEAANVNITPTAIFMGSIFSSNDDQFQSRSCKPKIRQGELCNCVAGPGEILAIRQTIFNDDQGRPVLEQYELEQGGQVIDDNGTWLVDVPMNLDYVITNEFGERVLSNDPKKGIPTKGKYRFKVKWNQSPKLSETLKRGYFLVPNIREYGWTNQTNDPLTSPQPVNSFNRLYAQNSYSFSLDWNEYGYSGTSEGRQMIQAAIDCEDKFYFMSYNKVYTVSQLIDQFRAGYLPNRTISIKNILDDTCDSDNNKFPTNDAIARFDIIFLFFVIAINLFKPILYVLLIVAHVLAFVLMLIGPILAILVGVVFGIIIVICNAIRILCFGCVNCPSIEDMASAVDALLNLYKLFTNLPLPNLTYPDCELCDCGAPQQQPQSDLTNITQEVTGIDVGQVYEQSNLNAYLSPFTIAPLFTGVTDSDTEIQTKKQQLFTGLAINNDTPTAASLAPNSFNKGNSYWFTNSITLAERLNLFNTKAKYFDNTITDTLNYPQGNNPGGGYNRIKVSFRPSTNANVFHYDNVLAISCLPSKLNELTPGQIISFQDPQKSSDPNLTGLTSLNIYGTPSITGVTVNNGMNTIYVPFAHPNGLGTTTGTSYNITQGTNDVQYAKFPLDVEYFQVITAMTYSQFISQCNNSDPLSFNRRYLSNTMVYNIYNSSGVYQDRVVETPILKFKEYTEQVICFLVRGVDPYSTKGEVSYDLSKLFGKNFGQVLVTGNNYKLNIPIQGKFKPVRHNSFTTNLTITSSGDKLYYESYHFQPGTEFSGFTTTLPSYYSSLGDTGTSSFRPGNILLANSLAPTLGNVTEFNNTLGSRVKISPTNLSIVPQITPNINGNYQNGFSYQYDNTSIVINSVANKNLISSRSRGYFQGEIVDGGSYMMQGPNNLTFSINGISVPYLYLAYLGVYSPIFLGNYYAPKYNNTYTFPNIPGSSNRQIIMRSDRLPTSTSLSSTANNSFPLHTNERFAVFLFSEDGVVTSSQAQGQAPSYGNDPGDTFTNNIGTSAVSTSVLDTFSCANLVPLGCYTSTNGEIGVVTPLSNASCYNELDRPIMKNGCYILVSTIFLSIVRDFTLLAEWSTRITISFGACRNVWSHMFTNNWINGTLYAFAFKNDRFFTSPFTIPIENANKPFSEYCTKTLILHPTNNFYYRSSPYRISDGIFIGAPRLTPTFLGINIEGLFGAYGGNQRFLNFPTTIMDLGPRSEYLQELVMADDFDGYVVNQLRGTTYTDISEILNLLIISRLVNTGFLEQLVGVNGASIDAYFDQRNKRFVDGDYAQLISISSELGISDFESANYPPRPSSQDPIYFNDADNEDVVIGIFFSSNTQVRDFITPKRTIISENLQVDESCTFTYFNVFTQRVPFYQWNIDPNDEPNDDSIFGSQKNDWFTFPLDNLKYFDYPLQSLDRANRSSRYFRSANSLTSVNYKGYIYQQLPNGDLSESVSTIDLNTIRGRTMTVGAPFHFYFGLKKGKTAWDRFAQKWINFDVIID